MVDPCQCNNPGPCPRFNRCMTGHLYHLCQTQPERLTHIRKGSRLPAACGQDLTKFADRREIEKQHAKLKTMLPCNHLEKPLGYAVTPMGSLPILGCKLHTETTLAYCRTCQDSTQKPKEYVFLDKVLPVIGKGSRIKRWSVGVITAPREEPTLERCVTSMIAAGWDAPRIFAEPGTDIPTSIGHIPVTQRETRANAWGNWYLALCELLDRQPNADAYMVAQDDTLFASGDTSENLRQYLERALWPEDNTGVVSIYCSSAYNQQTHGWHLKQGKWVWGALAFIWPRESLQHFLLTTGAEWMSQNRTRKVDIAVGFWQQRHAKSVYFCYPSLAQHIGNVSTIWGRGNKAVGRRAASEFLGDMV